MCRRQQRSCQCRALQVRWKVQMECFVNKDEWPITVINGDTHVCNSWKWGYRLCNHDYVYIHGGSFESLLDFHGPKQNRSSFNWYRPMVTLRKEDSDLQYGIEISPANGLLSYLHIHLQFMSWSCHGKIGFPFAGGQLHWQVINIYCRTVT